MEYLTRRALLRLGSAALLTTTLAAHSVEALSMTDLTHPNSSHNAIGSEAEFFGMLDLFQPALADVRHAALAKDWPAAKAAWATHLESASRPHWLWSRADRPLITQIFKERYGGLERDILAADAVLARDFDLQGIRMHLEHDLDWHPVPGEWTNVLNRFSYWPEMGQAYWATGDAKYAADFVYMLERWIAKNPVPADAHKSFSNSQACWRTLECGIRIPTWFHAMQLFMDAPEFGAEAKYQFTKSLLEHGRYLSQWTQSYRNGNWQVVETTGLATLGIMLPECKDAADWRTTGLRYLTEHMHKDVEPDGMHWEMTPSYHGWVAEEYIAVAQLCKHNGIATPGLLDRHEKMFEALMTLSRPDGCVFPLGDTHGKMDIRNSMGEGALLYGRTDMRSLATDTVPAGWIWTFGPSVLETYPKLTKHAPAFTSSVLSSSHYVALRTGWEPHDSCLLFDGAPWHGGHNHLDALQVLLYAGGRDLLIDPGIGDYDADISKTYLRTTAAHNVLMVDGKEQPHTDPTLLAWDTAPTLDYASGFLEQNNVRHQRSVVFVKPGCWVVVDTVTAAAGATDHTPHELTRLFHLPADAAPQSNGISARTGYRDGTNALILPVEASGVQTQVEMRKGYLPGPRRTAIEAPVAALVTKSALPITLCTVLVPFTDSALLPTVERVDAQDAGSVHLRLHFPDRTEEVVVSSVPQHLKIGDNMAFGSALCVRPGAGADRVVVLGSADPAVGSP